MDWTIREAGVQDAELILPLLIQVHDIHVAALPLIYRANTPAGEFLALLQDLLGRDGFTGLIAVAPNGSALGYVLYEIEARERTPVNEAQELGILHHASVDRDRRPAGIGLALVEAMKARLRAAGDLCQLQRALRRVEAQGRPRSSARHGGRSALGGGPTGPVARVVRGAALFGPRLVHPFGQVQRGAEVA